MNTIPRLVNKTAPRLNGTLYKLQNRTFAGISFARYVILLIVYVLRLYFYFMIYNIVVLLMKGQPKSSPNYLRSSFFGLPITSGTILGIYTVPTFVVLVLSERLETQGPPKDWKK